MSEHFEHSHANVRVSFEILPKFLGFVFGGSFRLERVIGALTFKIKCVYHC
jgi:hypothetical protein